MKPFSRHLVYLAGSGWSFLAAPASASAATPSTGPAESSAAADCSSRSEFHADLELDPTAYALDGFSLHAGVGWNRLRVDLGVFGLRVPEFVHQQPDFEVRFDGYGVKVQYFPFATQRGAFIGLDGALSRSSVRLQGSQLSARDNQLVVGANAGWRFEIVGDFYATTWLGLGYAFGQADVTLGGETFTSNPLVIFPAVHLGYRLR
ncbi:MAG TPA: hypothetical protein VJV79_13040 [Polyangiaceae bacterium]|nr:hypothetical protein [Polyangiaceae bacterium]